MYRELRETVESKGDEGPQECLGHPDVRDNKACRGILVVRDRPGHLASLG